MHQPDQLHAVLDLFDGEIVIKEEAKAIGENRLLQIKKLLKKDYVKNPIALK